MAGGFIILLLATAHILQVLSATVNDIRLIGDNDSYIDLKSLRKHVLSCTFKAGYDDQVSDIRWFKDNNLAYSWKFGAPDASAYGHLLGYVTTSEHPKLQNLNFKKLSLNLSGNYTCEVSSALGTSRSKIFHLVILDISNDQFETHVTLVESASKIPDSSNCTLLWDFRTPAIYPKPNVTCGYYSYLHDDIVDSLPAGLAMQLLSNGSWQAGFDHIPVEVADIPRKERLGCTVSVPDTSYKKVIKFEDSFVIDHLIDSEGCPTFPLNGMHNLIISAEGGEINCRGDTVPTSNNDPTKISFSCDPSYMAVFPNGIYEHNWSSEFTCNPELKVWQRMENGVLTQVTNTTDILPICVPVLYNGATINEQITSMLSLTIFLILKSIAKLIKM